MSSKEGKSSFSCLATAPESCATISKKDIQKGLLFVNFSPPSPVAGVGEAWRVAGSLRIAHLSCLDCAGLLPARMISNLRPLLRSHVAWASRVSPTALPGDGSHQFHIRVEATDNSDHVGVELQGMIVVEKGARASMLHDQHMLLLAHPSSAVQDMCMSPMPQKQCHLGFLV